MGKSKLRGIQRWSLNPPRRIRYSWCFLYHDEVPTDIDEKLIHRGLDLTETFEVVVIREGNHKLQAVSLPQGKDYAKCAETLPTMRVVPYRYDAVWVRRNKKTERLMRIWQKGVDDWRLSLLRAVYITKPFLYLLPEAHYDYMEETVGHLTVRASKASEEAFWSTGVFRGEELLRCDPHEVYSTGEEALRAGSAMAKQISDSRTVL